MEILGLRAMVMKNMYLECLLLFKSLKNHWLLAYKTDYENCAKALSEEEAKKFLMQYDLESYEKYFGELEEA